MNPLVQLEQFGQAFWLDYIRRNFIAAGDLDRLVDEDGLKGITSNPSIFEKAIAGSTDYASQIEGYRCQDADPQTIFEALAVRDIQAAADILQPVYEKTGKRDGYVSLEVSPGKARDTAGTIEEAKRLWKTVSRPNLMVKVPATEEGLPAIEELISSGINVNVTLLFDQDVYEQVARAYIRGVERLAESGGDCGSIASVASFFVSRIDTAVDSLLNAKVNETSDAKEQERLRSLLGKTAIANARRAYVRYLSLFGAPEWQALAAKGAKTQRLLWASTSTKNPKFRDVLYVEELIGRDTVNTMPQATAQAFRDHGKLRDAISDDPEGASRLLAEVEAAGVSLKQVTGTLLTEGLKLFSDAFDQLMAAIRKASAQPHDAAFGFSRQLPAAMAAAVDAAIEDWRANNKPKRIWDHDASLWTGQDEAQWLGWLDITTVELAHARELRATGTSAKTTHWRDAVVLGMGGSSLCPEVLALTFGKQADFPTLHVLDSTDPAQIRALEQRLDLANTGFIVSSKSGTTLEPNIFQEYFYDRVKQVHPDKPGDRFLAVTDPGSKMEAVAHQKGFRHVYYGLPSIGGRYSALSNFGMAPAAVMGLDVERFLERTEIMVHACTACVPANENPGVQLGTILGTLGNQGRNKVTLFTSPALSDLGAWLEQLLAESTGKEGKGLIPVDREPIGPPEVYGQDRIFAYTRLESEADKEQSEAVDALAAAGHPVVRIVVKDLYDLGQEFFRWEFATAVAGSILGINPFNQPDVEASKLATRKLTSEYEKTGQLAESKPLLDEDGVWLFADERNARDLQSSMDGQTGLAAWLRAHLNRLAPGDYFALLAYIQMNPEHESVLGNIRKSIRDRKRVATCLGFGPRFLHSTGQAYKGGPNSGVFLQITCNDPDDLSIPGQRYTFGVVKAAQALGDLQVLEERERRALRLHIAGNLAHGLDKLHHSINAALGA